MRGCQVSAPMTVKVFIGSGEASIIERKVLIYSIKKNTNRDLDIYVFNGTHNSVERNEQQPFLAPLPLKVKYQDFTEFSNYRWLIPELCGHQGRAIYLDSDMVCLADIGELFDADMGDYQILAKQEAYEGSGKWGLSAMLIDCANTRFDVEELFAAIDEGLYTAIDLHQLTPKFLEHYPVRVGPMDPNWNAFDDYDDQTKLIHYTNLFTQPWKFPGHPKGELWFRHFREALNAGIIAQTDVDKSLARAYVRQDIMTAHETEGTRPHHPAIRSLIRRVARKMRLAVSAHRSTGPWSRRNVSPPSRAHRGSTRR